MAKYRDIDDLGKSKLIPKRKLELASDRHERRLNENYKKRHELQQFCLDYGLRLFIQNHHHHWIVTYDSKIAEWWPATAKCVFDHHYKRGIHVHDHQQLIRLLIKRWKLEVKYDS